MTFAIGLDVGGTKIAGALYDEAGKEIGFAKLPTPPDYDAFLDNFCAVIAQLEAKGKAATIGACSPYADENANANMPFLIGHDFRRDLAARLNRKIVFGNDANCAALAEQREGAGRGFASVFGLIMGTGVGGGFIFDGKIVGGVNGLGGEIGHIPLPFYEEDDGDKVPCGCGQTGCIDKLVSGPALARLFTKITGKDARGGRIAEMGREGDPDALRTLDRFYTTVAKAMVAVIHTFDPEIIAVSGGANGLPGMYEEVPKRWGRYCITKNPKTKFVQAELGSMAGLRGAAWLGKSY